eukprot:7137302-Pyramimonas_sp.AAC.1
MHNHHRQHARSHTPLPGQAPIALRLTRTHLQGGAALPARRVPDAYGLVVAGRCQMRAVAAVRHAFDLTRVALRQNRGR